MPNELPESPSNAEEVSADAPSNDREVAMRERADLAKRAALIAGIRRSPTTEPPSDLSEAELARRLIYDMIHTLARSEVVTDQAVEAVAAWTEELRRANRLRLAELNLRERELAHQVKVDARNDATATQRLGLIEWGVKGLGGVVGSMFRDPRVVAAIAAAISTLVTTLLATWGLGGLEHMIPPEAP